MKNSSQKFKDSIDKEFGKLPINNELMQDADFYKGEFQEDKIKGGLADNKEIEDILKKFKKSKEKKVTVDSLKKELKRGVEIELEHTKSKQKAKEIAMDHLSEDPNYYKKLSKIENSEAASTSNAGPFVGKVAFADSEFLRKSHSEMKKTETKEATSSSSVGAYSTPAFVAPNKKNWRGAQKPLYKGGKFVKVKKKCLTFPYCNQGDIKSLKLLEGSVLDVAIKNVSEKLSISEETIKNLLAYELKKNNKTK